MQIAYREWRVFIEPETNEVVLYSTFMFCPWEEGELVADQIPESKIDSETGRVIGKMGALHGVHAAKSSVGESDMVTDFTKGFPMVRAIGAVDVYGLVVEHEDDILRAEAARVMAIRLIQVPGDIALSMDESLKDDKGRFQVKPFVWNGDFEYVIPAVLMSGDTPLTLDQLEKRLLTKYQVPRLEPGLGPWYEPIGERLCDTPSPESHPS